MISCFKGKFKVTSPRGNRVIFGKNEFHKGIDLVGITDKNVYAIADGTVYTLYEKEGFGNYVRQHLADGRRIYYGHLSSFKVANGQTVKKGQVIGVMGATGRVTGAHTHLEIRPKGTGSNSLDICEFTGIPNKIGTYEATNSTEKSIDEYIKVLNKAGIITNVPLWKTKANSDRDIYWLIRKTAEHIEE